MSLITYQPGVSPKILIVGGMPRSGTTMLKNLFNTHPDVCVTGEFKNFNRLGLNYFQHLRHVRRNRWHNRIIPFQVSGQYRNLGSSAWNLQFIARYVLALLPHAHKPIDIETVRRVLHQLFPDKAIVGDKYPRYWMQLDCFTQISGVYPVMIYRDCRDVVQSTLRMVRGQWAGKQFTTSIDTPEKIATSWVECIAALERNADKIFSIRYETLVCEPDGILQDLGKWLDIDPYLFTRELIHAASIGKYRGTLTFEQITQIETIAGATMERLGYV